MSIRRRTSLIALLGALVITGAACQTFPSPRRPPPATPPTINPPGIQAGNFVINCSFNHRLADDPIVKPNQPGTSHSHDFFGNISTNAASTLASLQATSTNCSDGQDRSGYWVPSLSVNGALVSPSKVEAYYQGFGIEGQVNPFPAGLKVVAGNASATTAQGEVTTWRCDVFGGGDFVSPPVCDPTTPLTMVIRFPDCWDGVNLDSADHKSHMTTSSRARATFGACPATHPVKVPRLRLSVQYPLSGVVDPVLASGGVFSGHADFFNAWNATRLANRVCQQINHNVGCIVSGAVANERDPGLGISGDAVNLDFSVATTPPAAMPMPSTTTTLPPSTLTTTTIANSASP